MQIKNVRSCENATADALTRLKLMTFDLEVQAELARGVPFNACQIVDTKRFDARTDWAA